ncbi:cyclase family protein, partial [Chloroflexota bacterium]
MAKFIDLSITFSSKGVFKGSKPQITYFSHEQRAASNVISRGLQPSDFKDGKFLAQESVTLGTHDGTHFDAPFHMSPTCEGKPSRTIDQIPLEWCYGDGVMLDFHHKKNGEGITTREVIEALDKIGYQLKPGDIVLIRTDADKLYGQAGYEDSQCCGVSREATLWLIEHGIKVMGIDAYTWDRPIALMEKEVKEGKKEQFFESHYLGGEREYCHMERLANLDKLPRPFGFKLMVFPIKI